MLMNARTRRKIRWRMTMCWVRCGYLLIAGIDTT